MELRQPHVPSSPRIDEQPTGHRCQANVGTEEDPRSCGEKMVKLDDWTFLCKKHGEMR